MSQNLRTSSSRSSLRPSATSTKARIPVPTTPTKVRSSATKLGTPAKGPGSANAETFQEPSSAPMSIREAIALRRAEAKKVQTTMRSGILDDFVASAEDASSPLPPKAEEEDILGRLPVRETIERARSTGTLNLATRSLPCIPSALFEIHLGVTPDPLKSVPNEPVLSPSAPADIPRRGKRDNPAWYEAQDLQVLKIWNNEIEEIQHEISLFGSLKTVDIHKNKLVSLPTTFADLTSLTTLDLSHNCLTSLPANIFALPELSNLNISHNTLSAIPFNSPFASSTGRKQQALGGNFFAPTITRAMSPLPRLLILDASHNKISANAIDLQIPKTLTKVDLSGNPLAAEASEECRALLRVFGEMPRLKELRLKGAYLSDDVFPPTLFPSTPFPSIRILDLEETKVTPNAVKEVLNGMKQRLEFELITDEPPEGVACVTVGKRIIKEAWEIEMERREKARKAPRNDFDDWTEQNATPDQLASTSTEPVKPVKQEATRPSSPRPCEVMKEAWEIEAERGLLTEGGRRRARAVAAGAALSTNSSKPHTDLSPTHAVFSLASPQYYSKLTQTLTLPSSAPPSKVPLHGRTFSMTVAPAAGASTRSTDLAVPAPTLPLSVIVCQPFAQTLKSLVLVNRRLDKSFMMPAERHGGGDGALLPVLEELDLEGCGLPDLVPVTRSDAHGGPASPPRSTEKILPLIARLFPSLRSLNLSGNALTSAAFSADVLTEIILASPSPERKGLKHLRIRGNRISGLEGFQGVAESFKGNRQVPGWHLDELDIRDNEIEKLPPEMGLLPLDVFLVDGNTFRVPPRRVWEREGTKGLLSWLRGRID